MRAEFIELATDEALPRPPIRIRTMLLLLVVGLLGYNGYPRARAAWQLHGMASGVADYALCMVGPTGPALIRDNSAGFAALVRRRLLAAPADEAPFAACAELARKVTGAEDVARAHAASASEFREYGAAPVLAAQRHDLGDISVTTDSLAQTSQSAWPFVRGGYTRLVKPSLGAVEAVHPIAPPEPAVGSGLPDWRARYRAVHKTQTGFVVAFGQGANLSLYETRDDGISWNPVSPRRHPSDFLERCPIDGEGRSFTFSFSDDGRSTMVNSLGPDGAPHATTLAPSERQILAAACDADGLVVALGSTQPGVTALALCPFRRSCSAMRLPIPGAQALPHLSDVARIQGTTVVAFADAGIVRVTSSRDGGRSWTPVSVAYDAGEHAPRSMGLNAPARLLTLEDRLLMYGGGARPDQAYLVLVSDDHGASWRTPQP